jgi:hypothetical protein
MLEIGFALLVLTLLGVFGYAMKESGKSSARVTDMEQEIEEFNKAMKKAKDNETAISNDYASGKPRRMQGKYDID